MYHERLITGVAATLGGIAVVLTVAGVMGSPLALPVAAAFAVSAALMYDQLSGRMAARVYERVERHARVDGTDAGGGARGGRSPRQERTRRRRTARRQNARRRSGNQGTARGQEADDGGGFGAGPREAWTPPRDGATAREAAGRQRRARSGGQTGGGSAAAGAAGGPRSADSNVSAASAYRILGLEPGADQEAIKRAYREKVKEVHPDTADGDEEAFMAVKDAYERLAD